MELFTCSRSLVGTGTGTGTGSVPTHTTLIMTQYYPAHSSIYFFILHLPFYSVIIIVLLFYVRILFMIFTYVIFHFLQDLQTVYGLYLKVQSKKLQPPFGGENIFIFFSISNFVLFERKIARIMTLIVVLTVPNFYLFVLDSHSQH